MRLTCPNCAARYEIAEDALPDTGRDVQCSDCGHTWFARRPGSFAPLPPTTRPRPAPKMDPKPYPADDRAPQTPKLSAESKAVLQAEVSREMAARQAHADAELERQEDLGLDDLPPADRPKGRDALPDVAIDDTMDAGLDAMEPRDAALDDAATPAARARSRWRFHAGFWTAVLVVAGLACLYILADQIPPVMPAAEQPLAGYVAWVDGLRSWLSDQAATVQSWLDATVTQSE